MLDNYLVYVGGNYYIYFFFLFKGYFVCVNFCKLIFLYKGCIRGVCACLMWGVFIYRCIASIVNNCKLIYICKLVFEIYRKTVKVWFKLYDNRGSLGFWILICYVK